MEEFETLRDDVETIETEYSPPSEEQARWLFDYTHFIWQLRAKLMGGYLTEDKKKNFVIKRPKGAKPLMTTEGVEETISIINGFVEGRIHGLTILTEERIYTICRDLYIKLAKHYYINMERYGLDPAKASMILRMIMNLVEANLRKSIAGKSLMLIGSTERVTVHKVEGKKKFGVI